MPSGPWRTTSRPTSRTTVRCDWCAMCGKCSNGCQVAWGDATLGGGAVGAETEASAGKAEPVVGDTAAVVEPTVQDPAAQDPAAHDPAASVGAKTEPVAEPTVDTAADAARQTVDAHADRLPDSAFVRALRAHAPSSVPCQLFARKMAAGAADAVHSTLAPLLVATV